MDTASTTKDRFWAKVQKTDTCWLWTGARTGHGYGNFSDKYRSVVAHRFAYELLVGPIAEGLTVDHLCRVRRCVNPEHLQPVTNAENILRGEGLTAQNSKKTACKYGHPFDADNTWFYPMSGHRQCKMCNRLRRRLARQKERLKLTSDLQ